VSPKGLFPIHPDFHGWKPPQERQALAEETEQKNAKALQGRTVSLGSEGRVFFFNFGSCVGVCFFFVASPTKGTKKMGRKTEKLGQE